MKKKLTSVLLFLALSAGVVSAQTSKVTGKVIGEDGEPVCRVPLLRSRFVVPDLLQGIILLCM